MKTPRALLVLGQLAAAAAVLVYAPAAIAAEPQAAAAAPAFTQELADAIANQKIALDTIW